MRRFLRETYIGAITIGLLLFNACQGLIQSIENPYFMWVARKTQPSVLMSQPVQYVNKPVLYKTLGDMLLYLFLAVLLIGILYAGKKPETAGEEETKAVVPDKA